VDRVLERFGADLRELLDFRAALFFALLFFAVLFFAVLFFAPPRPFLRDVDAFLLFDFFAFFAMIASRSLPVRTRYQ
jgi:hypothetical protein